MECLRHILRIGSDGPLGARLPFRNWLPVPCSAQFASAFAVPRAPKRDEGMRDALAGWQLVIQANLLAEIRIVLHATQKAALARFTI